MLPTVKKSFFFWAHEFWSYFEDSWAPKKNPTLKSVFFFWAALFLCGRTKWIQNHFRNQVQKCPEKWWPPIPLIIFSNRNFKKRQKGPAFSMSFPDTQIRSRCSFNSWWWGIRMPKKDIFCYNSPLNMCFCFDLFFFEDLIRSRFCCIFLGCQTLAFFTCRWASL